MIVPAILIEPVFIVPAPATVPVVLADAALGNERLVVIVRTMPVFTLIVEPFPTCRELHVRLPSTVRVKVAPTTMSSVAVGIIPPGQTDVELQFPEAIVVIVAALETKQAVMKKNAISIFASFTLFRITLIFMIIPFS